MKSAVLTTLAVWLFGHTHTHWVFVSLASTRTVLQSWFFFFFCDLALLVIVGSDQGTKFLRSSHMSVCRA